MSAMSGTDVALDRREGGANFAESAGSELPSTCNRVLLSKERSSHSVRAL
jgi:hypothetical protein